jgi:ParB-like chromosome segregation protein Spo0J
MKEWAWEYHDKIELAEIDLKTSEDNPARLLSRLDEDRVLSYAVAMLDGVEFPAIVLLRVSERGYKYLIATGVHRIKAALEAKLTEFDAYIVNEAAAYRSEALIRQANTIEGHGVSIRDRIAQVLLLHERYPAHSLARLAKEWDLNPKAVPRAWTTQTASRRARRLDFNFERLKLPQNIILGLNRLHSDKVFTHAAELIINYGLQSVEAEQLLRALTKERGGEAEELKIIRQHQEEAAARQAHAKARHGRLSPAPASGAFAESAGVVAGRRRARLYRRSQSLHQQRRGDGRGSGGPLDATRPPPLRSPAVRCETCRDSPVPGMVMTTRGIDVRGPYTDYVLCPAQCLGGIASCCDTAGARDNAPNQAPDCVTG